MWLILYKILQEFGLSNPSSAVHNNEIKAFFAVSLLQKFQFFSSVNK